MQRPAAIRKHREGGRPNRMLRNIKYLPLLEMQLFHEPVQLPGADAPRGRFKNFLNHPEQLADAGTVLGRQEQDGRVIQELELVANTLFEGILPLAALSRHLIPFIDADDDGAPALV